MATACRPPWCCGSLAGADVGRERIGQGAEAEVFEWGGGQVVRLLRAGHPSRSLAVEIVALGAARAAGLRVPHVHGPVVVNGRSGLVMERLEGPDLLTLIGQRPWLVFRAGRVTGELHARINAAVAPAALPAVVDVARDAAARLARAEPLLGAWVGRLLNRLPDGEALCHGDLHPGQIMLARGECATLDWSTAKRGDPLSDFARTRVLLALGTPPPGTALPLRLLAGAGRRLLVAAYVRAYTHAVARPIDHVRVRQWEVVNIAMRLGDNIPGEGPRLLQHLRRAYATAHGRPSRGPDVSSHK